MTKRGRPKGSGIDDSKVLKRIAEKMQRDPRLPATTAMKQLGIDNPSVIRRIKNKINASRQVSP